MTHLRSLLVLLLLCPSSIFALARLNVLEVNATYEGAPEIKFVTPACRVIQFQTGSDLSISARPHSSYLAFTGWNYSGRPIASTIRGNEYIEFECRLDAGAQQVTAIDVYASRNGSGAPTRLAIVATAGRFSGTPTGRDIRGGMALPRLGESPDVNSGKSFEAIPINPDSPVFTLRIYPDGTPAIDQKSSAREATVTIDALVIHSSTDALPSAVRSFIPDTVVDNAPSTAESNYRTPSRNDDKVRTGITQAPQKKLMFGEGKDQPRTKPISGAPPKKKAPLVMEDVLKEKKTPVIPIIRETIATPITLELGREIIGNVLTPVGMMEGDAQLLSADIGLGCKYVLRPAEWVRTKNDAQYQFTVAAYRGWAPLTDGITMDLSGALKSGVYCEYTIQFGPSVNRINQVFLHLRRRGPLAPPKVSLFTFSGDVPPRVTPADANGFPLSYAAGPQTAGRSIAGFKPIRLEPNQAVTLRFYFWGYWPETEDKEGSVNFDKIVFMTE